MEVGILDREYYHFFCQFHLLDKTSKDLFIKRKKNVRYSFISQKKMFILLVDLLDE